MNRTKLRAVMGAVFLIYSLLMCYFLFFAYYYGRSFNLFNAGYFECLKEYVYENINIIPFATVTLYIRGYLSGAVSLYPLAVNLIGNFTAFMPLGFFLPYFSAKLRKPLNFVIFTALLIIAVELLQLVMMTGVCDVDDLILNVSGATFVFFICRKIWIK